MSSTWRSPDCKIAVPPFISKEIMKNDEANETKIKLEGNAIPNRRARYPTQECTALLADQHRAKAHDQDPGLVRRRDPGIEPDC